MADSPVSRNVLQRKTKAGATWLDVAKEWAEETVEGGPSSVIHPEHAEAIAQVLLALLSSRSEMKERRPVLQRDAVVQRRVWGPDDDYRVIELQVDGVDLKTGDMVKVEVYRE